jgi:tRNA threonylcarbamoyladenosine biosynthesis protein TsaE
MVYQTFSPKETIALAKNTANKLNGGDIVLLEGDLGAGKTTFTKGMAEALHIPDDIVSPTFTLMQLYSLPKEIRGIKKLVHIDTYRLDDAKALQDIGALDFIGEVDTLTIIEWPEKIMELLVGKKITHVLLRHEEQSTRTIDITLS